MTRAPDDTGRAGAARPRIETALLGALALALALTAALSLGWRPNGDAAIMLYAATLANEADRVVYRDVFDMNAPGAHLGYRAVAALAGTGDLALRVADLVLLAAVLLATALALRPFGRRAAWAGAILAGLLYLGWGDSVSLQRELLLLLPVSATLALVHGRGWRERPEGPPAGLAFLAGACAGAASAVKPQGALVLLVIAAALPAGRPRGERPFRPAAGALAGFAAVWACVLGWLWTTGALSSFVDVVLQYWPLYDTLTGRPYRVVSGWSRLAHVAGGTLRGLAGPRALWVLAALGGAWWVGPREGTSTGASRRPLLALAFVTLLFPGLAGKFWAYHWLPFGYAAMLLASLALSDSSRGARWPRLAGTAVLAVAALGLPSKAWRPDPRREAELARVDRLALFFARNLGPGDTVQPLDWTGTALHAMLRARVRVATPFLEDVHFYHHASSPYVRRLRASLVEDLRRARPRFVVEVDEPGWAPSADSRRPFPELRDLLEQEYRVRERDAGYVIHERRAD